MECSLPSATKSVSFLGILLQARFLCLKFGIIWSIGRQNASVPCAVSPALHSVLQFLQAKRVGEGTASPCEQDRSEKSVGMREAARRDQRGPKLKTQSRRGNAVLAPFPTAEAPWHPEQGIPMQRGDPRGGQARPGVSPHFPG